ncbi:hypothetical protein CERSUDRAFT_90941 [Gelatoporia subvermispora B]|uniref:Ras GEF n=1 Tax=Ceriporiopsis subvermispora (strain B) TaxID=914234 RepID=M2RD13_CERS8|nr:hypothetical protein CERSUDRAFT_90941 [Gelatoporia subvermispora B]
MTTCSSSSPEAFYVICLFDFETEDPDQLSFKKSEILEIVKRESSGWWAAVSRDNRVGWVPSTYLEPISDVLADKLREGKGKYAQRQSPAVPRTAGLVSPIIMGTQDSPLFSPEKSTQDEQWLPLPDADKASLLQFSFSQTKQGEPSKTAPSPSLPPHEGVSASIPDAQPIEMSKTLVSRLRSKKNSAIPRSPSLDGLFPMNKPSTPSTGRPRSNSNGSCVTPPGASSPRQLRRRPVLIDDENSLNRLTTLFETSNLEQLDVLVRSPDIVESLDALSRAGKGLAKQLNDGRRPSDISESKVTCDVRATPWYLQPMHDADSIRTRSDGFATAGTLEALVERLTLPAFVSSSDKYRDVFLTTMKTFTSAEDVLSILVNHYRSICPSALHSDDFTRWRKEKLEPTQIQILIVFELWVQKHRMLKDNPHIMRRLVSFLRSISGSPHPLLASMSQNLVNEIEKPTPHPERTLTKRHMKKSRKNTVDLLRMDPTVLAEHLALYERKLYGKITDQECLTWGKAQAGDSVEHIAAFLATQQKLAEWAQTSILDAQAVTRRGGTIDFWIKVAEKCRSLNNFASLSTLCMALSGPVIGRLHLTWAHTTRGKQFEELRECVDPAANYEILRHLQDDLDTPCVPFIKSYLSDIIEVDARYTDNTMVTRVSGNVTLCLINFVKREKWYDAIDKIVRHQTRQYAIQEDPTVMAYVEERLIRAGEKDQGSLWLRSQELQQAEMDLADIRKWLGMAGF